MTTLTRPNATQVTYDPTVSGVVDDTVQEALDSLLSKYRFIRETGTLVQGATELTTTNIITDYDTVHLYFNGVKQQPDTYTVTDDQLITLSEPTPFTYKYMIELSSGATFLGLSPGEQILVQNAINAGTSAALDADRAETAANNAEDDAIRAENAANTATALGGAVYVTTDQTVGGIKTFTNSPLVPTATLGDASTKAASTLFVSEALSNSEFATLAGPNTFSGAQTVPWTTLTDAATIFVDASFSNNFRVTLGGNRTLANPSNLVDGQILNFRFKQDATGGRLLGFDTKYKFAGGTAPTASTAANARDFMSCIYDGAEDVMYCSFNKGY